MTAALGESDPDSAAKIALALDDLVADPGRRRILIVEMAHLPDAAPEEIQGARKGAFRAAIAELLRESADGSAEPRHSAAAVLGTVLLRPAWLNALGLALLLAEVRRPGGIAEALLLVLGGERQQLLEAARVLVDRR